MENDRFQNLRNILAEMKLSDEHQSSKKLDLARCERVVKRLDEFSATCDTCDEHIVELDEHFSNLHNKLSQLDKHDFKNHKQKVQHIISHLQKQHKLVADGHYTGIYMSLGTSLGLVFGLTVFDNLALGLPIGIGVGVAIGSGKDADAKKKGLTI